MKINNHTITVTSQITIDEIAGSLNFDDAFLLIKAIDNERNDKHFTKEVAIYFLRKLLESLDIESECKLMHDLIKMIDVKINRKNGE